MADCRCVIRCSNVSCAMVALPLVTRCRRWFDWLVCYYFIKRIASAYFAICVVLVIHPHRLTVTAVRVFGCGVYSDFHTCHFVSNNCFHVRLFLSFSGIIILPTLKGYISFANLHRCTRPRASIVGCSPAFALYKLCPHNFFAVFMVLPPPLRVNNLVRFLNLVQM